MKIKCSYCDTEKTVSDKLTSVQKMQQYAGWIVTPPCCPACVIQREENARLAAIAEGKLIKVNGPVPLISEEAAQKVLLREQSGRGRMRPIK
jgi:hypothetical protein